MLSRHFWSVNTTQTALLGKFKDSWEQQGSRTPNCHHWQQQNPALVQETQHESIPPAFHPLYPQLRTSETCRVVISCQKHLYQQLAKTKTSLFFFLKDCNMDLKLPNLGWLCPKCFPQHRALQLLHSQLDTAQSRDQRIYLYCPPVLLGQNARSETLVHLLHSFGSSLLGFFSLFWKISFCMEKKTRAFIFPGWIWTHLSIHPLCLWDICTNIRLTYKNLSIVWNQNNGMKDIWNL